MSKKIDLNEEELKAKLDPLSYEVLRHGATERPFTGEYIDVKLATRNYFARRPSFTPDAVGHLFTRQLQMTL